MNVKIGGRGSNGETANLERQKKNKRLCWSQSDEVKKNEATDTHANSVLQDTAGGSRDWGGKGPKMKGKGSTKPGLARVDENGCLGGRKTGKYRSVDEGESRQLRQRAAGIEFAWVNDPRPEAEAFPFSETPTRRSTRSIAPDTFKPSHRRLE